MSGFLINPYAFSTTRLISILAAESLMSGLLYAVDAGDLASYPGSGTQWIDTSGNGNHFDFVSDPAFSGTAGGLSESEYFVLDGNDYFSLVAGPTFDDGWAKDNGVFTFGTVSYPVSALSVTCGNANASAQDGVLGRIESSSGPFQGYYTTSNTTNAAITSVANTTINTPTLCIFGLDEATNAGRLKVNHSAAESFVTTSTTCTDNTENFSIGAWGNGNQIDAADTRYYMAFAWSRLLSAAEMNAFATALTVRFPNMP